MPDFKTIRYEGVTNGVARIVLSREKARNAQDKAMTYELNEAFDLAAQDDDANVIVLAADGPHFSSGHDLRDRSKISDFETVSNWGGSQSLVQKVPWQLSRRSILACAGGGEICRNRLSRKFRAKS